MYSLHTHDGKSNASRGFPDSSIKLEQMVKRAKEIGLTGVAITNHETVGSFVEAKSLEEKLDFPVICGNEIYLVSDDQYDALRYNYQKGMFFPHFILLAKDKIGANQLFELSTRAWVNNSFVNYGLMRTPTKTSDIEEVIGDNKGHLIATSACLGGYIPRMLLRARDNPDERDLYNEAIDDFIQWCLSIFGKDFYLETQPPTEISQDQIYVNDKILIISDYYNIPYVIASDAHYLKKELLPIHSSFLNSKETDEREVESFYKTAYLMSSDEVVDYFKPYWTEEQIRLGITNTVKIGNSCERYNFDRQQVVPKIPFEQNWEKNLDIKFFPMKYEYIQKTLHSTFEQDRYLLYLIQKGMLKFDVVEDYPNVFERIEQELAECWHVSEALNDRVHDYFITLNKILDIFWDRNGGDSLVGTGRGSVASSKIAHLLEIIQVDPLKMPVDMPFYRFMDRARPEMMDIDVDSESAKRYKIFNAVKRYFESIGGDVVNCCTYGKYGSKSAIKTACRGLGLSPDEGSVIASIIPSVRGFTLSIDECYYGDEEKGTRPIKEFVNAVNKHEGLLEIAKTIEGVYVNRGVHASGVFITNSSFTEFGGKMLSPKGIVTSQFDLHEAEKMGALKYDFLTVSALDKIRLTLEHLIANGHISKESTLKETYYKHFGVDKLDYDHPESWEKIHKNEVTDLFQFDSMVAMDAVSKIKPTSLVQLMQTNSLMRLQQQEGATETPVETYTRFKNDPTAWDKEMDEFNVPQAERVFIRDVLDIYLGVADTQESMMALVRHANISNFDVAQSHFSRKVVAKKSAKDLVKLKELFFTKGRECGTSQATLEYIWQVQIMRQASYAFSILHTLVYTFIALIELTMYTKYPSIYWNCACLTVNAEAMEDDDISDDEEDDVWASNSIIESAESDDEEEDGQESILEQKKTGGNTDYGKVASAIAKMQTRGVHIALPNINTATLSFYPDEKLNRIMFGLKGISGINNEMVRDIIENRPYINLLDFHERLTLKTKTVILKTGATQNKSLLPVSKVITLIKGGVFDELESNKSRVDLLKEYVLLNSPPKQTMTLANLDSVIEMGIVPEEYNHQVRMLRFKKFVCDKAKVDKADEKTKSKKWFKIIGETPSDTITHHATTFFEDNFISYLKENEDYYYSDDGVICVLSGASSCKFDKIIDEVSRPLKQWLNSSDCLDKYNEEIFKSKWNQITKGKDSISKWEMDSVGFYYHDHELLSCDNQYYEFINPFEQPEEPVIIGYNTYRDVSYPKFNISRIAGTVVSRNKTKHTVTLLTIHGAITVKYESGQFTHYDKQISVMSNGKNVTLEDGWFKRGNLLIVSGYRRGDTWKAKKYKDSIYQHTTMLIEDIREDGKLIIKQERSRV